MKRAVCIVTLVMLAQGCGSLGSTFRAATPEPTPIAAARPTLAPRELAFTWLGAAGVLVRTQNQTVAVDPYVTRANIVRTVIGSLRSDTKAVDRWIPKVDLILVGHSHADHVLDVPYLARRDNAPVVGSLTTSSIAQTYGTAKELIHVIGGGERLSLNGITVHSVKAGHGTWILPKVTTPGVLVNPEPGPLRGPDFKMGGAFFYRFTVDGIRVGHLSSGALAKGMPKDLDVDVLFVSLAASKDKQAVLEKILASTHPAVVVPIHFDLFFMGLEQTPRRLPGYDPSETALAVSTLEPKATTIIPDPMREVVVNVDTRKYR